MRTSQIALALTLTAAAATTPLTAQAAPRTIEKTKIVGHTAVASWGYIQGNIVTFVNVVVSNNNVKDSDGRSTDAFVSLAISQAEVDTGNVLIAGSAYTEDFDFQIDKDLGTATLSVRNAIFQDDDSFTFFNVDMDLSWSATAEATTQHFHDRFETPGLKIISRFKGDFREGMASGSIFGKNIQFTPVPSTFGQLQFDKFGSITITTGL